MLADLLSRSQNFSAVRARGFHRLIEPAFHQKINQRSICRRPIVHAAAITSNAQTTRSILFFVRQKSVFHSAIRESFDVFAKNGEVAPSRVVDGYRAFEDLVNDTASGGGWQGPVTTTDAFSASGVGAGSYYVRVKATNSTSTSPASNEALLNVGGGCTAAPPAPTGFTNTFKSNGTVTFVWNASANATTYIIEAGSTPGATNLANANLGSSATTATFNGVGNGVYFVRLRAQNTCGTSGVSNEVTLILP